MASLSAEDKVEFLLNLLATSSDFKPNYGELAKVTGINTPSNTQRRFKGIVEAEKKFILQSNKEATKVIKDDYGGACVPAKTPETPKKSGKRQKKKEDEGDEGKQTPAKRRRINGSASKDNGKAEDNGESGVDDGQV